MQPDISLLAEKMLGFAVQPPARTRPGVALYPPVTARLSDRRSIYQELSQVWAVASLVSGSGEVLSQQLGGRVVDSAHPIPESSRGSSSSQDAIRDRAYFYLPDLVIYEPGRYRIRISLMRMNYSYAPEGDVRVDEYVDSHSIVVEDGMANRSRPSE
jgi:hypothetical protein